MSSDSPAALPTGPWTLTEAEVDYIVQHPPRLAEVERSGLLAEGSDEALDQITSLGLELLGAPVCFAAVVDSDHDFYKSQVGFGEPLATERRLTGRTFCHYTLAARETLVIPDTLAAAPWREVPTVHNLGVRAYLGVPLRLNDEVIGSLCCIDVAPRDWTEVQVRTLQALAQSLERSLRLRQSLADADRASTHLRELMQQGQQEVAAIAHDLKAPISVFNMALLRLDRKLKPHFEGDPTLVDVLDQLKSGSSMMKELAETLRTGSFRSPAQRAPGQAEAKPSVVQATALMDDARRLCQALADREGVRLKVQAHTNAPIAVHGTQMLRGLANLIDNAVKFSPAGSTVHVVCDPLPPAEPGKPRQVRFTVRDAGAGIAAEDQARLFDRGYQGEISLRRGDGSGLGLAIVRDIVEAHGGRVALHSEGLGHGTTATVTLPQHQADA